MRLRLTHTDLFALSVGGIAIAAAFAAALVPPSTLARTPLCWSVILLGRECPGCGLTRSFAAIGRGGFAEANAINPLGPVLFTWAAAVVAVRCGKQLAPSFRYWSEIDIGFAAAALLAMITRTLLFYFA